ncbi:alpha-L-fucosidase [Pedobacter sp. MW01-1-1]|uniref:alpha-L-fucosidase n=1 Tax=Pedobacter sp. MW01-1-1 TaxID=3383027 RepID=UPI003FED8472
MMKFKAYLTSSLFLSLGVVLVKAQTTKDKETVKAEHGMINMANNKTVNAQIRPNTLWYPEAKLGLFIHWGVSSVKNLDLSWPMIPGRGLAGKTLSDDEIQEIVTKKEYNRYTERPNLTPNQYWEMARDFNPQSFEPEKWIKEAKKAGFTYAVLTARHHEGFSLWPSAYGNFNTKTYGDGQDFVKKFVDACRKYGLKVGLYYSPPDWYFDKEFMNFLYYKAAASQPKIKPLDADLNPRTTKKTEEERQQHYADFKTYIRGQITELLTNYGKIDLLWFDGQPNIPNGGKVMTREEILQLQPDIVINPRLHGKGDFVTFEREAPTKPAAGWAEFCNTWTTSWTNSTTLPFKAPAYVEGQLAAMSSLNMNYLLGIGPDATGKMSDKVYKNLAILQKWMVINGEAIKGTSPLPATEIASVPATANKNLRYLFLIPSFDKDGAYPEQQLPAKDMEITLTCPNKPKSVKTLEKNQALTFTYANGKLTISCPANKRSTQVDVVKVVF